MSDSRPLKRITVRHVRRRTHEELTTLARQIVTREILVTADEHVVRSAFMMLALMPPFTKAAGEAVGAFIGHYRDTIPNLGMNGLPIFLSVGFLHKADLPFLNQELERMHDALGTPQ